MVSQDFLGGGTREGGCCGGQGLALTKLIPLPLASYIKRRPSSSLEI
jgi:hypothetical protein